MDRQISYVNECKTKLRIPMYEFKILKYFLVLKKIKI